MTRSYLIHLLCRILPRPVWNALMRLIGKPEHPPLLAFGNMRTEAPTQPLTSGRFAEICRRLQQLDPNVVPEAMRYRIYNIAMLAKTCVSVPGDFVFIGISYGVAPRVTWEFADLASTGKPLHLVDPFTGSGTVAGYNTSADYVRRQYPGDAPVVLHQQYIPDALPLPGVERICFVSADTSAAEAECRSIPILHKHLSPGGIMMFDCYSSNRERFDAAFAAIGEEPIWLPSGQCFVLKR